MNDKTGMVSHACQAVGNPPCSKTGGVVNSLGSFCEKNQNLRHLKGVMSECIFLVIHNWNHFYADIKKRHLHFP